MKSGSPPLWRRYLRFIRPDTDADVDDELRFHLEQREAHFRALGHSPQDARDLTMQRFGDVEAIRRELRRGDARRQRRIERVEYVEELIQDLRHGIRTLWHQRAFSFAAIATLALGIGSTTAMFTAVDAALLKPLPFHEPDQLVSLTSIQVPFREPDGDDEEEISPDLRTVRTMGLFEQAAAYAFGGLNLVGDGEPLRVGVGVVTPNLFTTLGITPFIGRGFTEAEERPGAPRTAILSWGLWQRRFGGDSVLGRRIELSNKSYEIVGVMPRGFTFPERSDLWLPLTVPSTFESFDPFRGWLPAYSIARLRPDLPRQEAFDRLKQRWLATPEQYRRFRDNAEIVPFRPWQSTLVGDRRKPMLVLLGATGLLLLIACVNVTNLMLVRAAARRREIAMRAVLGATRGRLMRQLLTESLVLSLAGALGGLIIAFGAQGVIRLLLPNTLSLIAPATVDLRVLGFAVLLAVLTGLGFGLWPAFGSSRTNMGETMKAGGHSTGGGSGKLRRVLVVVELAVALTLLAGTGLMVRSMQALLATDPGFEPRNVGALEMSFPRGRGRPENPVQLQLITRALAHLDATPGIDAAGIVNDLPLKGGISVSVRPEGQPEDGPMRFARYLQASAGYFHALNIALLRGRLMGPADDDRAPLTVVVNATLAKQLWPGEDAVGKRIHDLAPPGAEPKFRTVIGVVADVREGGLEEEPTPQMYFSMWEQVPLNVSFVARGTVPPDQVLASLRSAVSAADPRQAVYNVRTMDEVLSVSMRARRTNTQLISGLGIAALLLAIVGVYGVVAYGVAQRTRELGIRAALGATGPELARLVAREGAAMAVAGVVLGLAGAYAFSKVLASLLYGVEPRDTVTFIVAPALLLLLVIGATLVPARRASRLNPAEIIRSD